MLTGAWLWCIVNNCSGVMLPWAGSDGAEASGDGLECCAWMSLGVLS